MFLKTWQVTVPHVDAEFFLLIGREQYWTWDRERSTSLADVLIIFPGLFKSEKKTIETKKAVLIRLTWYSLKRQALDVQEFNDNLFSNHDTI